MSEAPKPNPAENTQYFFNPRELGRLAVYRAAVVARFYTDQCEEPAIRLKSREVDRLFRQPHQAESNQLQPPAGPDTVNGDMKAP